MKSAEAAIRYLEHLGRPDLAAMLHGSQFDLSKSGTFGGFGAEMGYALTIYCSVPISGALSALSQEDRRRVAGAFLADEPLERGVAAPTDFTLTPLRGLTAEAKQLLVADLVWLRETMISVSTGGRRIQDVEDEYRVRHMRSKEGAAVLGVAYTNPHDELWAFYEHWKQNFGTYHERRSYVRGLFQAPVALASQTGSEPVPREPTGWERVDRGLARARSMSTSATKEEDFQAIGLVCRGADLCCPSGLRSGPACQPRQRGPQLDRRQADARSVPALDCAGRQLQGDTGSRPGLRRPRIEPAAPAHGDTPACCTLP
jgi:hypothetical protein